MMGVVGEGVRGDTIELGFKIQPQYKRVFFFKTLVLRQLKLFDTLFWVAVVVLVVVSESVFGQIRFFF